MHYHKVLILGSNGTLGQALVGEFEKAGCQVFAWNRNELDITDKLTVKEKISKLSPDLVINATAVNAVDDIETDDKIFDLAKKVNGEAVGFLAQVANDLEIPLAHYSTDYVFDGENRAGYKESDSPNPISRYGQTKLMGEEEVLKRAEKYYLIRVSRLFGKAGESQKSKMSFVDLMLDLVLNKKKEHLNVVDEEISAPSYAPDVAKFTREILEKEMEWGIYHGANDGGCSWYDFAKKIFEIKNIKVNLTPVKSDFFPRPAKRPNYSVLLNTKMLKQRGWEEALEEYLK